MHMFVSLCECRSKHRSLESISEFAFEFGAVERNRSELGMRNRSFERRGFTVKSSLQKRNHNAPGEAPHGFPRGSILAQAVGELPGRAAAVVVEEVHMAVLGCDEVEGWRGAVAVEGCVADAVGSARWEEKVAFDGTEAGADDESRHAEV